MKKHSRNKLKKIVADWMREKLNDKLNLNKGQIIRKGFMIYLKITGELLKKPVYFEIRNFAIKDKIKGIIQLSDKFDIDLFERKK